MHAFRRGFAIQFLEQAATPRFADPAPCGRSRGCTSSSAWLSSSNFGTPKGQRTRSSCGRCSGTGPPFGRRLRQLSWWPVPGRPGRRERQGPISACRGWAASPCSSRGSMKSTMIMLSPLGESHSRQAASQERQLMEHLVGEAFQVLDLIAARPGRHQEPVDARLLEASNII